MLTEEQSQEMARFNNLSADSARQILAKMEGKTPALRSCWYCNGAHEHLKEWDDTPIMCFACGIYYVNGYPAKIAAMRSKDTLITEDVMLQFYEALKEAEAQ